MMMKMGCGQHTTISILLLSLLVLLQLGNANDLNVASSSPSLPPLSSPQGWEGGGGGGEGQEEKNKSLRERQSGEEDRKDTVMTVVVHESLSGQVALAGVLGACVGLLGGFVVTTLLGCCYLKCSRRGTLMFDRKNITYRSADVIDGGV